MTLSTRVRIAGILAIFLLMLGAPGALAGSALQVDALIRTGSGSYVGNNLSNDDGTNQSVTKSGVVGQKLTFFIKIQNEGAGLDSYKVKRSAGFTNGYRVRYYDAANNDVTGKVSAGTFTTPSLSIGGEYVMRATVKIRSLATECSFTRRLITVSSVGNPSTKDAVRFTAGLAPGCPDLTLSPGVNVPPGSHWYNFAFVLESQTFTVTNNGTGPTDVLGFNMSGFIAIGNDSCTGSVLAASGMCSFELVLTNLSCNATEQVGVLDVTGGVPPTTNYLTLYTYCGALPV